MSGNNNLVGAAVRIAKSPDEVLSLIAKHVLTIELGKAPEKRQGSLLGLTDLLINNTSYITEDSVSPLVRAMKDPNEDVAITADVCVITVATDSPKTVLSTLVKEANSAKGSTKKRMSSTVSSIYIIARKSDKPQLAKLAGRYGFRLGDKKVVPFVRPKPKAPAKEVQKIRRRAV